MRKLTIVRGAEKHNLDERIGEIRLLASSITSRLFIDEITNRLSPNERRIYHLASNWRTTIKWKGEPNRRRVEDMIAVLDEFKRENPKRFERIRAGFGRGMYGISLGGQ